MVIGADAVAIIVAFGLAWAITRLLHDGAAAPLTPARFVHLGVYIVGWMLLLAAYHLYDLESLLDGFMQYERIAQASTTGLLLLVGILAILEGDAQIPRSLLLLSWLLSVVILGSSRFILRRIVWRLRRHGYFHIRILIVGAGEDGVALADQLRNTTGRATDIVGFLDEYAATGTLVHGVEVLGEPLELERVARQTAATEAILAPRAISWESLHLLLEGEPASWGLQHVWLAPAIRDLLTTGMEVHRRGSVPLISVTGLRIGGLEWLLKRALDVGIALALALLTLPISVAVTFWLVAMRHTRPIVKTQALGDGRRRFMMYTFPPEDALRQWHVWRLPALFNVVRGDMSLVGPRPMVRTLEPRYRAWRSMLACARPGLTGPWWLMSGTRKLSIDAEVAVDLSYIRNFSIWSDLHILAMTARKLCSRRLYVKLEFESESEAETPSRATEARSPTRAIVP
jgi:lipopolysaccharide/colanic/teichoic acid biosynthesis glycosyltransferase